MQHIAPKIGSDKNFGLVFGSFFLLVASYQGWHGNRFWWAFLVVGLGFGAAALLAPHFLHPLNYVWFRFGLLLNRVVAPVVLGVVFFLVIVPIAAMARLSGKDGLRLKRGSGESYWIVRTPPGPTGESMRNQY